MGLRRTARSAGTSVASTDTPSSRAETPASVGTWMVLTPHTNPSSVRASASEAARPIATPIPAVIAPFQTIDRTMRPRVAPSATRSPISRVAAVGLYGMVAFTVQQRSREIAIRMALGAGPRQVVHLVGRFVLGMVVPGLLIGTAGAVLFGYLARAVFYGTEPLDARSLGIAGLASIASAALASYGPVRHALKTEVVETIRVQ
jgi:uncharacterized membrane protein